MLIDAPIVEPFAVADTFATSMVAVDDIGSGCYRFTFCINQKSSYTGEWERVVIARIIMPEAAAKEGARVSLNALGDTFFRNCNECLHVRRH